MTDVDRASSAPACPDENALLAFAEGRLEPSALDAIARHLEGCPECRRLVGLTAASDQSHTHRSEPAIERAWTLSRGASVGRYVVVDQAGRGGMSEVYAAYDPELDRKVALKLLYAAGGSSQEIAQARLLREAKAIAKLSHPNVVTVYDAGTVDGRIFIAMEFVDGHTLKDWLAERPRSRPEILQVFVSAARGLAAAHAAGLVHRDFKPQNVMVGTDGGVRVMDFGLVRDLRAEGREDRRKDLEASFRNDISQLELTLTGELLGTPRYMAPEQFRTEATDARTDQFSFCVALYEALYGQRPFEGDVLSVLMKNVIAGTIRPPPARATVPVWLRRVLLRGLEVAPQWRFTSMNELIAALENDPGVRQRRLALGLAGALAIGAVAMGARHTGAPTKAPLCREGAQHWASIWAPGAAASPQRDAIHGAFAATGRLYAERAFFAATALLDQYVAGWLDMYRETCEATAVKGEQSTEVLDLRMACLNERVLGARAVIDTFAHADATVVENAISAVSGLPRLARCADVPLLRAVVKPPEDEKVRKRVADLRGDVARLVAERDAGHFVAAEQLAQAILPRVRETGYKPLLADTLNAAAQIGYSGRQPEIAPARFREAYIAALACGHDEAAITAALLIAEGLADTANRPGEARQWLDVARSLLERIGGNALLESWILLSEGVILEAEGRTREAVIVLQRSRAAKIRLLGEKAVDVLKSTIALSNAYLLAGQYEQARAEASAAVAGMTSLLGPDHPIVAAAVDNEAEALNGLRRFEEAAAAFQRSLDIMKVAGADPLDLAIVLTGFGIAQVGAGRPAAGVPLLEQALHLRTEKRDLPARLGETRFALARALWAQSTEHERARTLATAARADYAKVPNAATKIEQIDRWLAHPSAGL